MSLSSSALVAFSRPSPRNDCYDVFLSFRGTDTRRGFTNNLYRSLRESKVYTFMDEKLLGNEIENLFEIVEKSKMAVVIYSENFASSAWCLRELERIMHLKKENKMWVIPIFYKVDIHELKHLTGKTGECFADHMPKYDETTLQRWKDVVINFGKVSGLSYKDTDNRNEFDFIMEVVNKIKENLAECKALESSSGKPHSKKIRPMVEVMERPTVKITGYFQKSLVKSIDSHPTKPWVLLCLDGGEVSIWNLETRMEEKSFAYSSGLPSGGSAKFIPEKPWIVTIGATGGFLRVFDYNTLKMIKEFKPSNIQKYTQYRMVVHPTLPYVLTTSSDSRRIKLWNWENDWECIETFKGHSTNWANHLAFNPKDSTSFATVSSDETIKIWSFGSSEAKFTINPPSKKGAGSVEYFFGKDDKLYLLCCSLHSASARIWDYESKSLVQTLEGHKSNVTATLAHPELPIIITGSLDKRIRIWNKNTYRLELEWKGTLGSIDTIGFIEGSGEVALGCERGMLLIKILDAATLEDE